ncbi:hypothetical protein [Caballeronia sp. dw_19]|uniref:hypothetical protein n=1 Tax=Caballeronia sp. dw_19 TaxID=2719791 RepID=UPI001BD2525C|nr:hypothetical protein [Caballeronia sp. dw_19]
MRDKSIHIRVEHDDYEKLVQRAGSMKMTPSAVARGLVLQGLWPIDHKHDALLDRLERLEILMMKVSILAASAVASTVIPPGLEGDVSELEEGFKEQMRHHIRQSIKQGKNVDGAYDKGRFDERNGSVCAAAPKLARVD